MCSTSFARFHFESILCHRMVSNGIHSLEAIVSTQLWLSEESKSKRHDTNY